MPYDIVPAFLIGVIAGLRSLTAPAVFSWAVRLGWVHPQSRLLGFMGYAATPWIFTAMAIGELIADQLPNAPARTAPLGFSARIAMGALCGAVCGDAHGYLAIGAVAGAAGAVAGTLGGYAARVRLTSAVGKDRPVALLEDALAIGGALWLVFPR